MTSKYSKDEKKLSLTMLPDVPLRIIVSFLPFEDAVTFSSMHPSWGHLQPTVQDLDCPEICRAGPRGGHFWPETHFDIPIQSVGLESVSMSFSWKDQGFGNRKGQIWLKLSRGAREIADSREAYNVVAPHEWDQREFTVEDHDVIIKAKKGDTLSVMRNVGGGGGHHLTVENFKIKIIHRKYGLQETAYL